MRGGVSVNARGKVLFILLAVKVLSTVPFFINLNKVSFLIAKGGFVYVQMFVHLVRIQLDFVKCSPKYFRLDLACSRQSITFTHPRCSAFPVAIKSKYSTFGLVLERSKNIIRMVIFKKYLSVDLGIAIKVAGLKNHG